MHIIPVIDLLDGIVVHAKQGQRQHYQPLQSKLTDSHQPLEVIAAILQSYPFSTLYIADLNAIQHTPQPKNNYNVVADIRTCFPELDIWLDAGISNQTDYALWQPLGCEIVLGSESFARLGNYLSLIDTLQGHAILSLDFMPDGYHGPAELVQTSAHWPSRVIAMSLPNVGTGKGMNTVLLQQLREKGTSSQLYAAGGISSTQDLSILSALNIQGGLIATALHSQCITGDDIGNIM